MLEPSSTRRGFGRLVLAALCLLGVALPVPARAQSAATAYQRLLARENMVRAASQPSAATLRALAGAYEAVTRAHPTSGYADNALWQAAGILELAYQRGGNARDRDRAVKLLNWLKKDYPSGSLAKRVDARLAALEAASQAGVGGPRRPVALAATSVPVATTSPAASAAPSLPAAPAKPPAASVKNITYSKLPKGDRVTIELSNETPYASSRAVNPDRFLIDLASAGAAPAVAERALQISGALLKSLTVAKGTDAATRLVLELAGSPRCSTFPLYNPFRVVVDVEADSLPALSVLPRAPAAASPTAVGAESSLDAPAATARDEAPAPVAPASTGRGNYSLARQLGLGVSRVVIDPGHGGHDSGALANGVIEAELVLDISQRLEALLNGQPGFDVVLTRRTDQFIPLEERTAIANRAAADMFISIHANSSPQPSTRGIETYFLDFAANPQAEAVAARENAASAQTMRLLPELVKAITLNNKLDESRELARAVQTSLVRRIAGPSKAVKDLGVKRAPFVVLIGAQMPSVLAEVSFLTNRADAGLLRQAAYRQQLAQALCDAVLKYRGSLKKTGTVAAIN